MDRSCGVGLGERAKTRTRCEGGKKKKKEIKKMGVNIKKYGQKKKKDGMQNELMRTRTLGFVSGGRRGAAASKGRRRQKSDDEGEGERKEASRAALSAHHGE